VLRQVYCPLGNSNLGDYIGRQNVKGVLEGHLAARRNNEVSFPCHPTAEP
jgi:hypothetical protein